MVIEIPDNIFEPPIDKDRFMVELAVELYKQDKVSLGRAAEIAGIPKMKMQDEVGNRGIDIHYTEEMYEQDTEAIKWLKTQRHGSNK